MPGRGRKDDGEDREGGKKGSRSRRGRKDDEEDLESGKKGSRSRSRSRSRKDRDDEGSRGRKKEDTDEEAEGRTKSRHSRGKRRSRSKRNTDAFSGDEENDKQENDKLIDRSEDEVEDEEKEEPRGGRKMKGRKSRGGTKFEYELIPSKSDLAREPLMKADQSYFPLVDKDFADGSCPIEQVPIDKEIIDSNERLLNDDFPYCLLYQPPGGRRATLRVPK